MEARPAPSDQIDNPLPHPSVDALNSRLIYFSALWNALISHRNEPASSSTVFGRGCEPRVDAPPSLGGVSAVANVSCRNVSSAISRAIPRPDFRQSRFRFARSTSAKIDILLLSGATEHQDRGLRLYQRYSDRCVG